ncbi:MAG: quinone oxidoreductase [Vicinamibacterales bacterium]
MRAIRVQQYGGPETMALVDVPTPRPGPGQALVRIETAGVNYIDVYFRMGVYKAEQPTALGNEGAGVVEALGDGVTEVKVGDRVAYAMTRGSYAEYAVVPAAQLVAIPEGVSSDLAAAAMLQGMTAHYLVRSTYPLKAGETCLVHAAAGGAGLLIVQMAKAVGARVIGTVSTEAKAALALANGADEIIRYTEQDFEQEVKRMTNGRGADVVYDSVGKTTFDRSLNCLRPRGMMVLFGQSSGAVPPFDPNTLNGKGSLYLTRPSLVHHVASRDELVWRADDVLKGIMAGSLKIRIDRKLPLADVAEAHRALESRATTGKLILGV